MNYLSQSEVFDLRFSQEKYAQYSLLNADISNLFFKSVRE